MTLIFVTILFDTVHNEQDIPLQTLFTEVNSFCNDKDPYSNKTNLMTIYFFNCLKYDIAAFHYGGYIFKKDIILLFLRCIECK